MSIVTVSAVAEPGGQGPGLEAVTRYEPVSLSFPGNDSRPHTVAFDSKSFMPAGQCLSIWPGEFHCWRLPDVNGWRDIFQKMRANGYKAVSLYMCGGLHQNEEGGTAPVAPGTHHR